MGSDVLQTFATNTSQPLPDGKLYHVFISHSSEDAEWVRQVVDKLESPEYGYKCCYADRDICIGVPILQNITTCIRTSMKTVIVMSPEFLKSACCSYETRITMELDIASRQRLLIPVMLRKCALPNLIGNLSYVNAESEHFWDRLLVAINEIDFYNGECVTELIINEACGSSLATGMLVPDELQSRGISVTQEEYDRIIGLIMSDKYLYRHGQFIVKCWAQTCFLCCIVCNFVTMIIVTSLISTSSLNQFFNFDLETPNIIRLVLVSLVVLLEACGCFSRCRTARRQTMKKVNEILSPRGLMASISDNGHCTCFCRKQLKIKFFFYYWTPCQNYLQKIIEERQKKNDSRRGNRHNLEDRQLVACAINDDRQPSAEAVEEVQVEIGNEGGAPSVEQRIEDHRISMNKEALTIQEPEESLLYFSMEYGHKLATRKLKKPNVDRHMQNVECLCQFAESLLKSSSVRYSLCECVFGGLSRRPCARFFKYDT